MPEPTTTEIPLSRVLVEEFEAQFGPLDDATRSSILNPPVPQAPDGLGDEGRRRRAFFRFLHERASKPLPPNSPSGVASARRSALCLSGGGIRSATFNLGILQRLARVGLLTRLDYLSTVSGGGYIGSWLSAWIYNADQDLEGVQRQLAIVTKDGSSAKDPVAPEPEPIKNLRRYSRFLSPRAGILSGDIWTLVAIYLRNLLLTLLVFIPILAAGVMVPRIATSTLNLIYQVTNPTIPDWGMQILLGITLACMGTGLGMMLLTQTSLAVRLRELTGGWLVPLKSRWALLWWFLPAAAGCMLLPVVALTPNLSENPSSAALGVGAIAAVIMIIAFSIRLVWQARASGPRGNKPSPAGLIYSIAARPILALLALAAVVVIITFLVTPTIFRSVMSFTAVLQHAGFGAALSLVGLVPMVLILVDTWHRRVLHVFAGVCAGGATGALLFLSRRILETLRPDDAGGIAGPGVLHVFAGTDEWVARCAIFGPPLAALSLCVGAAIYVGFISRSRMAWDADREWWARAGSVMLRFALVWTLVFGVVLYGPVWLCQIDVWGQTLVASAGGVSGLLTILLGASAKTASSGMPEDTGSAVSRLVLKFAAPIFIVVFFGALSLGMSALTLGVSGLIRPGDPIFTPAAQFTSVSHMVVICGLCLLLILLAATALFSRCVNFTRFSLHGMYRDRLIRAFLGASSNKPDRDPFTNFDDRDNIYFGKLRVGALRVRDFAVNESTGKRFVLESFAAPPGPEAQSKHDRLVAFLYARVSASIGLGEGHFAGLGANAHIREVVDAINGVLLSERLGNDHPLDPAAAVPPNRLAPTEVVRGREWLRATLPQWFSPLRSGSVSSSPATAQRPFHIINTALNIVAGSNNAWQDRKAASQTFSPFHAGCAHLGYRDSRAYGGPRGFSLGGAMTLSGAAVSPNQGYHSSPTIAFLLALFNVRLGSWCPNPGAPGEGVTRLNAPKWTAFLFPLLEAIGKTDDTSPWVYLSDGGHFDNLGLYEMVQRRCHSIVVIDAGADPNCELFDLGNAIRKIRVDLGIPIDLDEFDLRRKRDEIDGEPPHAGSYCGIGTIRYDVVDGPDAVCGRLLYIKPSIYWKEPADVLNYARTAKDFPHETTTDQWFTEPQFESYRQLGWHILKTITDGKSSMKNLDELISEAEARLKPAQPPPPNPVPSAESGRATAATRTPPAAGKS